MHAAPLACEATLRHWLGRPLSPVVVLAALILIVLAGLPATSALQRRLLVVRCRLHLHSVWFRLLCRIAVAFPHIVRSVVSLQLGMHHSQQPLATQSAAASTAKCCLARGTCTKVHSCVYTDRQGTPNGRHLHQGAQHHEHYRVSRIPTLALRIYAVFQHCPSTVQHVGKQPLSTFPMREVNSSCSGTHGRHATHCAWLGPVRALCTDAYQVIYCCASVYPFGSTVSNDAGGHDTWNERTSVRGATRRRNHLAHAAERHWRHNIADTDEVALRRCRVRASAERDTERLRLARRVRDTGRE